MQYVFVIDQNKNQLDLYHPARALELLASGRAAIFRRFPLTIILKDRFQEESVAHEHRIKLDPGSKATRMTLVREGDYKVLWAGEIQHRGQTIIDTLTSRRAMRCNHRAYHTLCQPSRFDNHRRQEGWLPLNLESCLAPP
jgi:hypothetical protein